jgi:hypothetical protein
LISNPFDEDILNANSKNQSFNGEPMARQTSIKPSYFSSVKHKTNKVPLSIPNVSDNKIIFGSERPSQFEGSTSHGKRTYHFSYVQQGLNKPPPAALERPSIIPRNEISAFQSTNGSL